MIYKTLAEAKEAAVRQQQRFSYGVLIVEIFGIFLIVPHRDEALITEGVIHYPTPKGEAIIPTIKKKKSRRNIIKKCPRCSADSIGLCDKCKAEQLLGIRQMELNR